MLIKATKPDKIIFYAMTFWILGFFLIPFSKQHYQVFLLTIVLSGFWLVFTLQIDYKSLIKSTIFQVVLAYVGLYLISIWWSNDPTFSSKQKDIKTVFYILLFAVVFLYVLGAKTDRLQALTSYILIAAALSIAINFVYFYGYLDHSLAARFSGLGRLWNALWAAALYGGVALVALAILLEKYTILTPLKRYGLVVAYLSFMTAVFLTQSRMPSAAVVVMSFVAILFASYSLKFKIYLTLVVTSIALLVVISLFPLIQDYLSNRGQSYRLDLWQGFWEQSKEHWLFGVGGGSNVVIDAPGTYVDQWRHYHSIYIGSLVEIGVVGLFLHLLMIVVTLYQAWRLRAHFYVRVAALIFIYACLLGLTFGHGIVARMNVQWLLYWMPLLIIVHYELKARSLTIKRKWWEVCDNKASLFQ